MELKEPMFKNGDRVRKETIEAWMPEWSHGVGVITGMDEDVRYDPEQDKIVPLFVYRVDFNENPDVGNEDNVMWFDDYELKAAERLVPTVDFEIPRV